MRRWSSPLSFCSWPTPLLDDGTRDRRVARPGAAPPVRLLLVHRWAGCSGELLAFSFSVSLFYVTYRYASLRRLPWRTALLASTFTAVLFEVAKRLYGLYLANFASLEGPLGDANVGAAVLFVLWVYYTAIVFLLGAVVAETWELRQMQQRQRAIARLTRSGPPRLRGKPHASIPFAALRSFVSRCWRRPAARPPVGVCGFVGQTRGSRRQTTPPFSAADSAFETAANGGNPRRDRRRIRGRMPLCCRRMSRPSRDARPCASTGGGFSAPTRCASS